MSNFSSWRRSLESQEDPGTAEGRLPWLANPKPTLPELVSFLQKCIEKQRLNVVFDPRARMGQETYRLLEFCRLRHALGGLAKQSEDFAYWFGYQKLTEGLSEPLPLVSPKEKAKLVQNTSGSEGDSSEGEAPLPSQTQAPESQATLLLKITEARYALNRLMSINEKKRKHSAKLKALAESQKLQLEAESRAEQGEELLLEVEQISSLSPSPQSGEAEWSILQTSVTSVAESLSTVMSQDEPRHKERRFPPWKLNSSSHLPDGYMWLHQVLGCYLYNIDDLFKALEAIPSAVDALGLDAVQDTVKRVELFRMWLRVREFCKHLSEQSVSFTRVVNLLTSGLPEAIELETIGAPTGDQIWNHTLQKLEQALVEYVRKLKLDDFNSTTQLMVRRTMRADSEEEEISSQNVSSVATPLSKVRQVTVETTRKEPPSKKRRFAEGQEGESNRRCQTFQEFLAEYRKGRIGQVSFKDRKKFLAVFCARLAMERNEVWETLPAEKKQKYKTEGRRKLLMSDSHPSTQVESWPQGKHSWPGNKQN